jgi:hypothetical protein
MTMKRQYTPPRLTQLGRLRDLTSRIFGYKR